MLLAATLAIAPATIGAQASESISQTCSNIPATTPSSVVQSGVQGATVGESITLEQRVSFDEGTIFQDIFTRPDGSLFFTSYLELVVPDSILDVDPATLVFAIDDVAQTTVAGVEPDPTDWVLETTAAAGADTYRVFFPGDVQQMLADVNGAGEESYEVPAGGQEFSLTIESIVTDVAEAAWGSTHESVECFATTSTGAANLATDRRTQRFAIVEPLIELTKSADTLAGVYAAGATASFTVTAVVPTVDPSGNLVTGPAHDTIIVDTLPTGLTPVDANGAILADGASTPSGGVFDVATNTLTFDLGTMDPGTSIDLDYTTQVLSTLTPGINLTNSVSASISTVAGVDANEHDRVIDGAASASETIQVASGAPAISKTSDWENNGTNLDITYTVTLDIPADASYQNLTIVDTLPVGMDFSAFGTTACSPTTETCPSVTNLARNFVDGFTTNPEQFGWYLNEVTPSDVDRTMTFNYTAQIRSALETGEAVEFLDEFNNTVEVLWNTVDRLGDVAPSTRALSTYDVSVDAGASVRYHRPLISVEKSVDQQSPWDYRVGQVANYTVVLTNVGSLPAHDVEFVDTTTRLAIDLSTVEIDGVACGADCSFVNTDDLTSVIEGPIAVGDSVTITYQGVPTNVGDVVNVFGVTKTVDPEGHEYFDQPSASTTVNVPQPALTPTKELASGQTSEVSITQGTPVTFEFTASNNSDAEAFNATATDVPPASLCFVPGSTTSANPAVSETGDNEFALGDIAVGASVTWEATFVLCGTLTPGDVVNTINLAWEDVNDDLDANENPYGASATGSVLVKVPTYEISKGPDLDEGLLVNQDPNPLDNDFETGEWTITVTSTSEFPIAGLVVTDVLPETTEYLPGSATAEWSGTASTFTDESTAGASPVFAGHTQDVRLVLGELAGNESVTFTVPFKQDGTLPSDGSGELLNTAEVRDASVPFIADDHQAEAAYTIFPAEPGATVVKTILDADGNPVDTDRDTGRLASIAETVTFQLDVRLAATEDGYHDVLIRDVMADGLQLVNEPAPHTTGPTSDWTIGDWNATCISGCAAGAEFTAGYVGSLPPVAGSTELFWYFGDFNATTDVIYRIEYTASLKSNFDNGDRVQFGFSGAPVQNWARPYFNRNENLLGVASGDVIDGFPTAIPDVDTFDRRYPRARAFVDPLTPFIDILKEGFDSDGNPVTEVDVGETISYEITVTNTGPGDAYNIVFDDDLGELADTNRLAIDLDSINAPAGVACEVSGDPSVLTCTAPGVLAGGGTSYTVTYEGSSLPSSELISALSTRNSDPDVIQNNVFITQYTDAPDVATSNLFISGRSSVTARVLTPIAEVDIEYITCPATSAPGSNISFAITVSNGDHDTNPPTVPTPPLVFDPAPTRDGVATGFNPELVVTLPASLNFDPDNDVITATGPVVGEDDYATYVSFPAPDSVVPTSSGGTTLTWTAFGDVPYTGTAAGLIIQVDTTNTAIGPTLLQADLTLEDLTGATLRGDAVGATYNYRELDATSCSAGGGGGGGGGGGERLPDHSISKTPDASANIGLEPGEVAEFTVTISNNRSELTGLNFTDTMPEGLTYLGQDPNDPDYAVATISPLPDGWEPLEDYYVDTVPQANGFEVINWDPTEPLPQGTYSITIPVRADAPAPNPSTFMTNTFVLVAAEGNRSDTGAFFSNAPLPTITKRAHDEGGSPGDTIRYTVEIFLPASETFHDLTVWDRPNFNRNFTGHTSNFFNANHSNGAQFKEYVSAECTLGCTNDDDTIVPIGLTPSPYITRDGGDQALPGWTGTHTYTSTINNDFGWYLGTILPDPEGQDRIVELTYDIEYPDFDNLLDTVIDSHNSYDDREDIFGNANLYQEISRQQFTNEVRMRWNRTRDTNAWNGIADPASLVNWIDEVRDIAITGWTQQITTEVVTIDLPFVEIHKECFPIEGGERIDVLRQSPPPPTDGSDVDWANVECQIEVTNDRFLNAYDVTVTDTPDAVFDRGWSRHDDPNAWSQQATYAGDISAPAHFEGIQNLVGNANVLPAEWQIEELEPNETRTLSYQLRIDPFTNYPLYNSFPFSGVLNRAMSWNNNAAVENWAYEEGGEPLDIRRTASSRVIVDAPSVQVSTFPYADDRAGAARPYLAENTFAPAWTDPATTDWLLPPTAEIRDNFQASRGRGLALGNGLWDWDNRSRACDAWNGTNCSWFFDANVFAGNLNNDAVWDEPLFIDPNETYSWAIHLTAVELDRIETLDLDYELPYGFSFIDGSARIVDGDWNLYGEDAAGSPTSYVEFPLFDPVKTDARRTACNAGQINDGGEALTWNFERDDFTKAQPWDIRYLDYRESELLEDAGSWVMILIDTEVDNDAVTLCDRDHDSNIFNYFEANARIDTTNQYGTGNNDISSTIAPLPLPVTINKTPLLDRVVDDSTNEFTIEVANEGDIDIVDVDIIDTLTHQTGALSQGYECFTSTAVGGTGFAETSCDDSVTGRIDIVYHFDTIPAGESVFVTMPMTIVDDEINNVRYTNTASITFDDYYDGDATLTDTTSFIVSSPSPPEVPQKFTDQATPTINEEFRYQVRFRSVVNRIYQDLWYRDTIPDGLEFLGYDSITGSHAGQIQTLPPIENADGTTTIGWWVGDINGTNVNTDMFYNVRLKDQLSDGTEIVDGDQITNVADGYSNDEEIVRVDPTEIPDPDDFFWTRTGNRTVTVAEPEYTLTKTATPVTSPPAGGSVINYEVQVRNTSGRTLYDLRVVDVPGEALEDGNITLTPTGAIAVRSWSETDPTIEWFVPRLDNNQVFTFRYSAVVRDDFTEIPTSVATNVAQVVGGSIFNRLDEDPDDRQYDVLAEATTETALSGPFIELQKFVNGCSDEAATVAPGQVASWCIQVTNSGDTPSYNVTVSDLLPAGWQFEVGSSQVDGAATPPTTSDISGETALVWNLGTIAAGTTVEITYDLLAGPDAAPEVVNRASVEAFTIDGDPLPASIPGFRDTDTATAAVRIGQLQIQKTPDNQQYGFVGVGGTVEWEIEITNPSNEDLANVEITDLLPDPLTYVAGSATSDYDAATDAADASHAFTEESVGSGPGSTTEILWSVPSLVSGASFTITIIADVPATVPESEWLVNDASAVADEVVDRVANQAKVRFFEPASIGDFVWFDSNGNGIQDATEAAVPGVVVNLLDGNGDLLYRDAVTGEITTDASLGFVAFTATTDADGEYLFDSIPGDDYLVEFVLPADRVFTWQGLGTDSALDSDVDRTTGRVAIALEGGEDRRDVDAGLNELGSIGDRVWLDADVNGLQDAAETGIAGIIVELLRAGADGLVGTTDDIVLDSTTTDASGNYLFEDIPLGTYGVGFSADPAIAAHAGLNVTLPDVGGDDAVDSDALPGSGTTNAFTITSDNPNIRTIDAGFGQFDPGSIGDLVWSDDDANGIRGGNEPGLAGITVNLLNPAGGVLATTTTNATGAYQFEGLPPSDYVVEFVAPTGQVITFATQGTNDSIDSDPDRATGRTPTITLVEGEDLSTVDAGFFPLANPASLGDTVWLDANSNGIQDAGEAGVDGVVVVLLSDTGVALATTTTDAAGNYVFSDLPAGDYSVEFTAPDDHVFAFTDQGADDTSDSDADRVTGRTATITLASGDDYVDADAGLLAVTDPANLGNFAWFDSDIDGIQDANESGIANVAVTLWGAGVDGIFDTADDDELATTTTGANGEYEFTELPPGDYQVSFAPPNIYVSTWTDQGGDDLADSDVDQVTGRSATVTLAPGDDNDTVDAGFYLNFLLGSLGDTLWLDADGDGLQDAGELGVSGVTVDLLSSTGVVLASRTTDADGEYEFANLPIGDYFIEFDLPADHVFVWQDQGSDDTIDSDVDRATGRTDLIELGPSDNNPDIDAGLFNGETAELGDRVWLDANTNGVQDAGETGVAGVVVNLIAAGPDGQLGTADDLSLDSTTTNATGNYSFIDLLPGEYAVEFELPANHQFTFPELGGDDTLDSDADWATGRTPAVTLAPGDVNTTLDAGLFTGAPASLGDRVWIDADIDGIQEFGEADVEDVVVNLRLPDGSLLATTTTDDDGEYAFVGLPAGDYVVEFIAPASTVFTFPGLGVSELADSDATRSTGLTETISLGAGVDLVNVDAGLVPTVVPASIGDTVWADTNGDGIQDAGEVGIAGVVVNLLRPDGTVLDTTITDAAGNYSFIDLPAGDYVIEVELPVDHVFTFDNQGTDDTADSDVDRGTGLTSTITVAEGDGFTDVDAGLVPELAPASLGDTVWSDDDADGIQDVGEAGIAGVVVNLFGPGPDGVVGTADDALLDTTTTDASGNYEFVELPAGDYAVEVELPADHVVTFTDQGTDDTSDSDVDRTTGVTSAITLAPGDTVTNVDIGLVPVVDPASIGDTIWADADGDGIQDAGEAGIAGVVVNLFGPGADGLLGTADDALLDTTTTDAAGNYSFIDLPAGDYVIEVELPADHVFTFDSQGTDDAADSDVDRATGVTSTITVAEGDDFTDVDAGLVPELAPASLGDRVWSDDDADGIQDVGEAGIAGVVVNLFGPGPDGVVGTADDVVLDTTTTDASGNYLFVDLPAGDYAVEVELPADHVYTFTDQGADDGLDSDADRASGLTSALTISSGDVVTNVDVGLVPVIEPASLGDTVWSDDDADGIQDADELGIAGVVVNLIGPGPDGVVGTADDVVLDTTTTDASGNYAFIDLPAGDYAIEVELPANHVHTFTDQGADDTADSDLDRATGLTSTITLAEGDAVTDVDAGLVPVIAPATIGDTVWSDSDGDGIQDAGEPGIAGVVVNLLRPDGTVLDTTTTDAAGNYAFIDLPAGGYAIEVELPADHVYTFTDQGTDDNVDSDLDRATGVTATISVTEGDLVTDVDAGLVPTVDPASLGDYVWLDADADGIQDTTDTPLSGVVVNLVAIGADGVFGTADDPILDTTTTDASGNYEFIDLPAGTYAVDFQLPANHVYTFTDQGLDDAADSDADRALGVSAPVVLAEGDDDRTIDAGMIFVDPAELGDLVWVDADADGIQDPGEPGLTGVVVNLTRPNGTILDTTTTDLFGVYEFIDLPEGDFVVEIELPVDYVHTFEDQGTDDLVDSDGDRVTGRSHTVTLAATDVDTGVDFGVVPTLVAATLGGTAWSDENSDGIQDAGETFTPGAVVNLIGPGPDGLIGTGDDAVLDTTTTDATGAYNFIDLPAGDYIVEVELPADHVFTFLDQGLDDAADSDVDRATGQTAPIALSEGDNITTVDAGLVPVVDPAIIGDSVWLDSDEDGIQDAGETGIGNVVVNLINAGVDGVPGTTDDAVLDSTTTDASGNYSFVDLPAGDYVIEVEVPIGHVRTFTDQGTDDDADSDTDRATGFTPTITLAEGDDIADIDAGFVAEPDPASIGDTVWSDDNSNGIQDAGEVGLPGVVVNLVGPGPDGELGTADDVVLDTTSTDAAGNYSFVDLPAGDYILEVELPTDRVFTFLDQGDDDTVDSDIDRATGLTDIITVEQGVVFTDADAGLTQVTDPSSLGGTIWSDTDADGLQDIDEAGIEAIVVNLTGPGPDGLIGTADDVVLDSTTTDADGNYSFVDLPAGDYIVEVESPTDHIFTFTDQGIDDEVDSDTDRATGQTQPITLVEGEDIANVDSGLVAVADPATISGTAWSETSLNGIRETPDTLLEGVTVNLLSAGPDGIFGTPDDAILDTSVTNANGEYIFRDLPPGNYTVEFVLDPNNPAHASLVPVWEAQGTDPSIDSDVNRETGRSASITVGEGGGAVVDAGYFPLGNPASISGASWIDENGDGIQDPTEPGAPGVVALLLDETGNPIASVPVVDGEYSFTNLPEGEYTVEFATPDDYEATFTNRGTDESVDSDIDPDTFQISPIVLLAGENSTNNGAGFLQPIFSSIGDYVWFDLNGNGLQDEDEDPINDITMRLIDASTGDVLRSTTTGDNPETAAVEQGWYIFDNLPAGRYQVEIVLPEELVFSWPFIGEDPNANSDFSRETLLSNIVEFVVDSTGGSLQQASLTFDRLEDGGRSLNAELSALQSSDNIRLLQATNDQTDVLTFPAGTGVIQIDAGIALPYSPEIFVWIDENGDGQQSPGEAPLEGITVDLVLLDGTVVATAVTGPDGTVTFANIPGGEYTVTYHWDDLPEGLVPTDANVGSDDTDSDADTTTGVSEPFTVSDSSPQNPSAAGARPLDVDLTLTKTLSDDGFNEDRVGVWDIVIGNEGRDAALGPIEVTDVLVDALTYDSFVSSDPSVTCSIAGQELTCLHDGDLAPGESFTISVTTTVDPDFAGEIVNTATVGSQSLVQIGDDLDNNADAATTTIEPGSGEPPAALAFTGSTVGSLVFIATLLMLVGFAFLAIRRRKEILA